MRTIDLHTHSLCSDGAQTPSDVVRTAKEAGLSAIALSDHDCIVGVQEAIDIGKTLGVEVIPAVELSAQSDTELHILGYFIDIHNKKLQDMMAYALQVRDERMAIHDFRMVPGEGHTNLIFDISLPLDLKGQEKTIQRTLENALNDLGQGTYYTVITFDPAVFDHT